MKIIKRKLLEPAARSQKSVKELIKQKKLKNKVLSIWEIDEDLKKKLQNQRKNKNPLIYPKIKYYSQNDHNEKYPYYYYLIEDLERFACYIEKDKFKVEVLKNADLVLKELVLPKPPIKR